MKPLDPRVLPHLRPARLSLTLVLVGNVAVALAVVGQAFALAGLVTGLLADPDHGWQTPALWLGLASAGRFLAAWLSDRAAAHAAGVVGVKLRSTVARAALDLPATELSERRTGELAALATRGVAAVEPYLTRYLPTLVLAALLPVITVVAIASQDWWSALIVVCTLPLVPVFAILIGLTTKEKADREWRALGTLAGHFLDVVRGLPTLVVHRRARAQAARIREVTERYRKASVETLRIAFASSAALELIATISVALVAVAVGLRLASGGLDLQTALAVLLLAPEAYWPLRRVGAEFHAAAEGTATFEAIHELLAAAPANGRDEIMADGLAGGRATAGEPASRLPGKCVAGGNVQPTVAESSVPHSLRLDNVELTWPGRTRPAVTGLDATIPATGITAIVGASGSGKSTLLQALLRELPLADGMIRVGGTDLATISPRAWQEQIAFVPQRPWLVADTVAANLRIGAPDASDIDLLAALDRVALREVVLTLPRGLNTELGEEGAGLSAGQRARLALARVLLTDRPYVLLDEPTAHLDATTEAVLLDVIAALGRDRCVIVVAHRETVIEAAAHVVLLPTARRTPAAGPAVVAVRAPESTVRAAETYGSEDKNLRFGGRWAAAVLLGTLAAASGVALTATAGWLIARAAEQPPVLMLTMAIVGVRTFGLARPVFRYVERLLSHDVALHLLADRRAAVYDALVPLVPARTGRRGDLLGGVVEDVDSLVDERLRVRMPLLTWGGVTVLATGFSYLVLPLAAVVIAAVSLGGGLAAFLGTRIMAGHQERALVAARGAVNRHVLDLLSDARSLVLWQRDTAAVAEVTDRGAALADASGRSAGATAAGRAVAGLIGAAGVLAVAVLAAPALSDGRVSGPMTALLLLLPLALVDITAPLADAGALSVRTRAASQRLESLTRTRPAVIDPDVPAAVPAGPIDVRLDGVTAAWSEDRDGVPLPDLDLPAGGRIGIVGPSGSGKSTLAAVLVRFLSPVAGIHTVSGVDAETLAADDLRNAVGFLDDDPYVFSSTLVENVRLARTGATDTEVADALHAAALDDWLAGLPDGLHTRIGDGGAAVSGGERARIGIARALLADPRVLVLDEPTAHLDRATADEVTATILASATLASTAPTGAVPTSNSRRSLVWITHDRIGLEAMDTVLTVDLATPQKHPTTRV